MGKDPSETRDRDRMDPYVRALIDNARKKGYLTYDELNQELPEDAVDNIDHVLSTLEENGIELVDESEMEEEGVKRRVRPEEDDGGGRFTKTGGSEKIDDPVRMYLTQMGEIPLLTRDQEINLARQIEETRAAFRRMLLSSGFGIRQGIQILEDVKDGKLAFDRTLKVPTSGTEPAKSEIQERLQENLVTLRKLYLKNQAEIEALIRGEVPARERKALVRRSARRRRKCARLLEELQIQLKKVKPLIEHLKDEWEKGRELERKWKRLKARESESAAEAQAAYEAWCLRAMETPARLERRLTVIETRYKGSDYAKRALSSATLR